MYLQAVLLQFGIDAAKASIQSFGSGLINNTWKISTGDVHFILQKINTAVFKQPQLIAQNNRLIADYLAAHHPQYLFVALLQATDGSDLVARPDGYYRLFPFVPQSHTVDVVQTPEQAFEAAVQFGRFTRMLSGLDAGKLAVTLPDFHDLSLRYRQFGAAQQNGNRERLNKASKIVEQLQAQSDIVDRFEAICNNPAFRRRATHHDTKINNVLFDEQGRGLCVIDLDTVMPGYFISDVGDMMRTYLSPVSEEEKDYSKISIRSSFYKAIVSGYLQEMGDMLTPEERNAFLYAGKFMTYMQALRFLTDFLNDDVYYGERYPGHNLVRATNQAVLLEQLNAFEQ